MRKPYLLLLLLLLLLVSAALADADADSDADTANFALLHYSNDAERPTLLAYAGHPKRTLPLALRFSIPGETGAALAHTNTTDVPGAFAALLLPPADPLAAEWRGSTAAAAAGTHGTLVGAPKVRLETQGRTYWFAANATGRGLPVTGHVRGYFFLGAGSAVYLRWRYAEVTRARLRLTDVRPVLGGDSVVLACARLDALGRCVVEGVTLALDTNTERGARHVRAALVLDFDRHASELPAALYGPLLASQRHRDRAHALALADVVRITWQDTLVLATLDDVGGGGASAAGADADANADAAAATPLFVLAEAVGAGAADDDDTSVVTVVLGRRSLLRLFRTLVFDSSALAWYVAPTRALPELVRVFLAATSTLQVYFLSRYIVGPLNLGLLRALQRRGRAPDPTTHVLRNVPALHLVLGTALALGQTALACAFACAGEGTDSAVCQPLGTFALVALVVAGTEALCLLLLSMAAWREGPGFWRERALHLAQGSVHATLSALGTMGAIVPYASISIVGALSVAVLGVAVALPLLTYSALAELTFFVVRPPANRHRPAMLAVAVVHAALAALVAWSVVVHVIRPVLHALNVVYTVPMVDAAATVVVALALLLTVLLQAGELKPVLDAGTKQSM